MRMMTLSREALLIETHICTSVSLFFRIIVKGVGVFVIQTLNDTVSLVIHGM